MTNIFRFAPRHANLPDALVAQARAEGFDPVGIDPMLEACDMASGRPWSALPPQHAPLAGWYLEALDAHESRTDPGRTARARRNALIAEAFDRLCPSIATLRAEDTERVLGSAGITLLFLYESPGCQWCVAMAEVLEALAGAAIETRILKVNRRSDPEIFNRFHVKNGVPFMMVFWGRSLRAVHMGYLPLNEATEFLSAAAAGWRGRRRTRVDEPVTRDVPDPGEAAAPRRPAV